MKSVYIGNSIPPIAQKAMESSRAINRGGSKIRNFRYLVKFQLNCLEIRTIRYILAIENKRPSSPENIDTSTLLTFVKGAVTIVHKKLVYPSTYSPGLYTNPSPFIRFLPYLYDIYASSTFWNRKLQLRKKQ
jgi:hypothetical protein